MCRVVVSAGIVIFLLVSAGIVMLLFRDDGDMVQDDLVGVASGEVVEVGAVAGSASLAHEVEEVVRTVHGERGRAHLLKGVPV